MSDLLTAGSSLVQPDSGEQTGVPFVERRQAQRRHAGQDQAVGIHLGFDDRRLGPGRRLDDWRHKPVARELSEALETCS